MAKTDFSSRVIRGSRPVNLAIMQKAAAGMPAALKAMGYSGLRKGQDAVISCAVSGSDVIGVLPTSAGKTACFVLPVLALDTCAIVFSPLVALMRDQVQGINRRLEDSAAVQMSGTQSEAENQLAARLWASGKARFFYVAPERLENQVFLEAVKHRSPGAIIIDEAHVVSQWSDNFRPDFCKIGRFVEAHQPDLLMAVTATCPPVVEADIRRVLGMAGARKVTYYFRRSNLKLMSTPWRGEDPLVRQLHKLEGAPFVVYGSTIKRVEALASHLAGCKELGGSVAHFHGQMNPADKTQVMDSFMAGELQGIVATNAFGMGVDKADIRAVIHRDIPGSLEAMAQETGRAGRDGQDAVCLSFLADDSVRTQRDFIEAGNPTERDLTKVFNALRSMAGPAGIVTSSSNIVGERAGIRPIYMQSALHVLSAHGVIERFYPAEKHASVKFTGSSEDEKFHKYRSFIVRTSASDGQKYMVDLVEMAVAMRVSETTLRNHLKRMNEAGLLDFVPPPKHKHTHIVGDLSMVDFVRLDKKRVSDKAKLEEVLRYMHTPDTDKHALLEEYFAVNADV